MSSGFSKITTILRSASTVDKLLENAKSGVVEAPHELRGDAGASVEATLDVGWTHLNTSIRMVASVRLTCDSHIDTQVKAFSHCVSLSKALLAREADKLADILPEFVPND